MLAQAEDSIRRTTDILHEHALRLLEIQDLVLHEVDRRIAGLPWEEIARSPEVHAELRGFRVNLDSVDQIWLTTPDGWTVASSQSFPLEPLDVSDREHVAALREESAEIALSRAFSTKRAGDLVFVVARRRSSPDGTHNGLIAVSIRAERLLELYRRAVPHLNHSVGLLRTDGVFLIRDAAVPPPHGAPQLASPSFHRAVATAPRGGIFTGVSAIDGVQRLVAYRKVEGYPVYVLLALGVDAVLAPWRQHVLTYGLLCGTAAAALFVMTLVALRRAGRERAALLRLEEEAVRREQAEAALLESRKLEAIGKLTGGIAHDFNNMLTAIVGSLDTIRRRSEGRLPELEKPIAVALQGADRAASLTGRLLAFARRQPLNPRPQDPGALVRGMEGLMRRSAGERVRLTIACPEDLWPALCDPLATESALLNLVINARDAMPDGGTLTVRLANVSLDGADADAGDLTPGDYVMLAVADTGTGMPAEVRARAFDPFFTTKPVGIGTGLGLSQVYGIVRQSGGGARIRSAPGEGTTVELYLPRHHGPVPISEPDPAPARPVPAAIPLARPPGGSPARILLVEDEAIVRDVSAEALRGAGFEVVEAADAAAALAVVEADGAIDLLVSDIGLPDGSGRHLAERARRRRPGLPVVYVTGYAGIVPGGETVTGEHVLPKPFTPDALVRRVNDVLATGVA
ncbi:hybrid sensor histidine kinase/response regulator [Azospirillum halopraeferens]|uniref:hybrid sensor histidine kinase/response regulator n=1 Tax=Azospirillum halopraeferens TaxID=34010 RepID=UPI000427364A|nr:hybrid sensor histidine kinase/response regulator [Azospirillum halopraeferens]